ncbi:MAG: SusC/RagA family TonB-linked outer membrane protein [Flavobacteriaceae bacterium]
MKTKFNGILTLLLAFVVQITFAQSKTISGNVSDESGPLPGVSVLIKGTSTGTETDFDGNYSMTANTGDVLQFSFIGMETQEMTIGAANTMNVVMVAGAEALTEVVVVGFGIKKQKKSLAYQAETVKGEDIIQASPTRAASALAGKVAGLQINIQNNGVNPSTQIILRGLRSISQGNQALIVIDGSIASTGAFDDLNPNDIKSLNVLKGASAAALYGSNASNGAIIVETKKGSSDEKFKIGINTTATFEQVAYMPDFQTEYGTGWQGAYDNIENTNWGPRFDGQVRQIGPTFADGTFQTVPYAPVKNNLKDFYNTGSTFQNTIYASGGDETSQFYMSIGNQETEGIVPNDKYDRQSFRINASKKLGNITLAVNSTYMRDKTDVVGSSIGSQDRPLYWFVLNTAANIPLTNYKDWQNDLFASPDGYFNGYYQNPYWAIDTNRNTDKTARLIANVSASWDIAERINFTTRIGINSVTGTGKNWRAPQVYTGDYTRPTNVTSFVTDSEFQSLTYTTDALLSGQFDLTESLTFDVILGATNTTSNFRSSSITASNLSIPDFYDVSNGTGQPIVGVNEETKKTYGFFADLTFGLNDYLFLHLSGRYDFTSTLAPEDNSYFYPGAGLSFVLTDAIESLKDGNILNFAKLTANYSNVYNDLPAYQINETYFQSNPNNEPTRSDTSYGFPFGSLNGFFLANTAVDANIKKEQITSTEFGANLGFFNNRLILDAAYFITKSTDLITRTTPSNASASTGFLTNIGELEGKGFEITVGGTIFKTDDWRWDASVNYFSSETVVNKISEGVNEITLTSTGSVGVFAIVGEAYPQIKATSYVRDPQGRVVVDPISGNPKVGALKNLGKTTPDYILGFNSSLSYKSWTIATTMDYRTGHVYYEQGSDAMEFTGRSIASVSSNRQDFVFPNSVVETAPGVYVENTNLPVTSGNQDFWTGRYNEIKENYVKDATAFKIREVSLNYSLPNKYLDNTPLSTVKVGFVARNILTVLPEQNRFSDPEFNNTNSNAIGIGGYFQSPPTSSYGININIEF